MQFITLTPLTLLLSASSVLAIDPIPQPFFCAIETFGACCITFNPPKSPFGKGCPSLSPPITPTLRTNNQTLTWKQIGISAKQILPNAARGVNEKRVVVNEFICE